MPRLLAPLLALALLLPAPCAAADAQEPGDRQESPDILDPAKRLARRQGEMSEETMRALQSGEAKAAPPVGATHGGMAAPAKPSKGGKAIYGDIIIHK